MQHHSVIAHYVGGEWTEGTKSLWHDDRIAAEAALAEQRKQQRNTFLTHVTPRALLAALAISALSPTSTLT